MGGGGCLVVLFLFFDRVYFCLGHYCSNNKTSAVPVHRGIPVNGQQTEQPKEEEDKQHCCLSDLVKA